MKKKNEELIKQGVLTRSDCGDYINICCTQELIKQEQLYLEEKLMEDKKKNLIPAYFNGIKIFIEHDERYLDEIDELNKMIAQVNQTAYSCLSIFKGVKVFIEYHEDERHQDEIDELTEILSRANTNGR